MAAKDELKQIWKGQSKKWQAQYLHSLGPNHPALKDQEHRADLATFLRSQNSAYAKARASGNPLWIWYAYRDFRDRSLPLPEWMLIYFDEVAKRLRTMMHERPKEPSPAIAEAMLMKRHGRGSVFSTFQNPAELGVVVEILNARVKGEPAHAGIGRAAQKLGVNKRTARRHRASVRRQLRERDSI